MGIIGMRWNRRTESKIFTRRDSAVTLAWFMEIHDIKEITVVPGISGEPCVKVVYYLRNEEDED